jgi:hypothetical protein
MKFGRSLNECDSELVLGNALPDLATYNPQYQPVAHNHKALLAIENPSDLAIGASVHVMADNYTSLNRVTFNGEYEDVPANGFVIRSAKIFGERYRNELEAVSKYKIALRRFIQCALEYLIREDYFEYLSTNLHLAERYLSENQLQISEKFKRIYPTIPENELERGLKRYRFVYGNGGIGLSRNWKSRLFPMARAIIRYERSDGKNVGQFIDPEERLAVLEEHPEVTDLVIAAAEMLGDHWEERLTQTAKAILTVLDEAEILR